jgi:hypothetical protein
MKEEIKMRKELKAKSYVYPLPVLIIGTYDENGNPIVVAEEPVIVETDDIDWRYFFSDEFVGGEISGVIIR